MLSFTLLVGKEDNGLIGSLLHLLHDILIVVLEGLVVCSREIVPKHRVVFPR
jgi:hypothetical protein